MRGPPEKWLKLFFNEEHAVHDNYNNWSGTVECRYNMVQFIMTATEHKSDIKLTADTPYLTLTGELWGVCHENFEENWPHYNGTALYYVKSVKKWIMCQFL